MPRTPLDLDTALDSLKLPSAEGSSFQDFLDVQISSAGLAEATIPLQDVADFRSCRACSMEPPGHAAPETHLPFLLSNMPSHFRHGHPSALPVEGMTIVGAKPGMDLTRGG